jgi:hypothetical protein
MYPFILFQETIRVQQSSMLVAGWSGDSNPKSSIPGASIQTLLRIGPLKGQMHFPSDPSGVTLYEPKGYQAQSWVG